MSQDVNNPWLQYLKPIADTFAHAMTSELISTITDHFEARRVPFLWTGSLSLQWRHNGHCGVSNHQTRDRLLNSLFTHRSKKTSKLRVTGLCAGNLPVTGEFPAQMASNAETASIWWRHHVKACPPWNPIFVTHGSPRLWWVMWKPVVLEEMRICLSWGYWYFCDRNSEHI